MNPNTYDTGVPPTNVHPKGSVSTRIESHIPGTQAHRERKYLEHEDQATFGRNHPVPPMNAVGHGAGAGVGAQRTTDFAPTNTFAPPTQPPPPPHHHAAHGVGQGVGQNYGAAPGMGADTGFGQGAPGMGMNAAGDPTFHKHGNTMGERVAELHGRGHAGAGVGTTGAVGNGTVPKNGPHIGDKITGGIESAIGRAVNNPNMEQAGWERKTFGTEAAKQGGVHPSTTKQPY